MLYRLIVTYSNGKRMAFPFATLAGAVRFQRTYRAASIDRAVTFQLETVR